MGNPFGTDEMAAGYAKSRPPVHSWVVRRGIAGLGRMFPVALDVGCGSGVSTRALEGAAVSRIGIEPAVSMLRLAASVAPGAYFAAGAAESIPVRDGCVDLLTAAGSLNYADVDRFFAEARRVLRPGGAVLVYDFSAGRSFREAAALDEWFERFMTKYRMAASEARELNPSILSSMQSGLRVTNSETFEMGLTLSPEFYVDYMLTETNVAAAVRSGVPLAEIRGWCEETLEPVWQGKAREVLFRGYWVLLTR